MGPTGSWLRASTTKLQTIFDEGGMKSRSQFDQGNGSRPKTHARLLDAFSIRVTSADMDVCVFCCSGERPRKRGVRFAKGLNTTIYKYISYSIHVWQFSLQK